jgi:hypothetical protein
LSSQPEIHPLRKFLTVEGPVAQIVKIRILVQDTSRKHGQTNCEFLTAWARTIGRLRLPIFDVLDLLGNKIGGIADHRLGIAAILAWPGHRADASNFALAIDEDVSRTDLPDCRLWIPH